MTLTARNAPWPRSWDVSQGMEKVPGLVYHKLVDGPRALHYDKITRETETGIEVLVLVPATERVVAYARINGEGQVSDYHLSLIIVHRTCFACGFLHAKPGWKRCSACGGDTPHE